MARTFVIRAAGWVGIAQVESPIWTYFREKPDGIRSGHPFRVGRVQFDHFDVMTEDQKPLFVRGGIKYFSHVLPRPDERFGVFADPGHWLLPLGNLGKLPTKLFLFPLKAAKFIPDAVEHFRSKTLQNFDQAIEVGFRLLLLPTEYLFVLLELHGLHVQTFDCSLSDFLTGLKHGSEFSNAVDDGLLQGFGGNAGGITRVLSSLVRLARADVVEMRAASTVSSRSCHMCSTRTAEQAGEKVVTVVVRLNRSEIHPTLHRLAQLGLNSVELLTADDRRVTSFVNSVAPANLPDVDWVSENAGHLLLGKELPAPLLTGAGNVTGITDSLVTEPACNRSRRAEFFKPIENLANDCSSFFVDFQPARVIRLRPIAKHMSTVPEAAFRSITHDGISPFGGHLSLKLGKYHDKLNHRLAGGHRRIKFLPQADHVDVVLCKERPEITADHVRLYKGAMLKAGLRPTTVARRLSVLRGVYRQFAEKGLVAWQVAQELESVKAPPVAKNTTPALTREQAVMLLQAIPRDSLKGLRDLALLQTFFITGCRVSALVGACVGHLEFDGVEHYLHVTEKRSKKARKILLDAARPVLHYIRTAGIEADLEGPLFRPMVPNGVRFERHPMSRKTPWRLVKHYCRIAGISPDRLGARGIGVHSLRKTAITDAIRNGAGMHEVREFAGHADIRTTELYYVRREEDAEQAARRIQIRI